MSEKPKEDESLPSFETPLQNENPEEEQYNSDNEFKALLNDNNVEDISQKVVANQDI
jgi:hypothetical protein